MNTRSIGWPMTTPSSTRTGATNSATWRLEPKRHRHRELHLVLGGELDGDEVLGEVADRRDEDDADEERATGRTCSMNGSIEPTRISDRTASSAAAPSSTTIAIRAGPGRPAVARRLAVAAERLARVA